MDEYPDLVIPDHYLYSVYRDAEDGLHILERIKRLDRHVRVIMLSNQTHCGVALQTAAKGAEQYVMKGKDQFDEIDRTLNDMLA